MAVPAWNQEWERPDPLRGARGWLRHHYASALAGLVLAAASLALLMPALALARHRERELDRA